MFSSKKVALAGFAALSLIVAAAPASAKIPKFPKLPHPHHHWGYGGLGVGLGLGLIGAAVAASDCEIVLQPVTDAYGEIVGYQRVRECQ